MAENIVERLRRIGSILKRYRVFNSFNYILNTDYDEDLLKQNLEEFKTQLLNDGLDNEDIEFINFCKRNLKIKLSNKNMVLWLEKALLIFSSEEARRNIEHILEYFKGLNLVKDRIKNRDTFRESLFGYYVEIDLRNRELIRFLNRVKSILNRMSDDFEKLRWIWFQSRIILVTDLEFERASLERRRENIIEFSHFFLNRKGVCLKKTIFAQLIFQKIGIKSYIAPLAVISTLNGFANPHAFNIVLFNNVYYLFDAENELIINGQSNCMIVPISNLEEGKIIINTDEGSLIYEFQ